MRYFNIYCFSFWQNYYILCFMKFVINIILKMILNYIESYFEEDVDQLFFIFIEVYKKGKMLDLDNFWSQYQGVVKREQVLGLDSVRFKLYFLGIINQDILDRVFIYIK